MSGLDAGVAGPLSPEEVAAQVTGPAGPVTIRARLLPPPATPAAPAPAPEPVDERPLEVLAAERDSARERLNGILEERLQLAARLEAVDRDIEAGRDAAPLSPDATREARAERSRLRVELAELDVLVERANAAHERAARAWQAGRHREMAATFRAQLADLRARAVESDAAIEAAIGALLDAEEARAQLVEDAKRVQAQLAGLPVEYHGADTGPTVWSMGVRQPPDPRYVPAGIEFDRTKIAALRVPHARKRRYLLGL